MIQYTETPTSTAIMSRMTQLRFWMTPQIATAIATAQMMKVMVASRQVQDLMSSGNGGRAYRTHRRAATARTRRETPYRTLGVQRSAVEEARDVEDVVVHVERRLGLLGEERRALGLALRSGLLPRRLLDGHLAVEAGRDDGDAHLVAQRRVDDGAEDDVAVGVGGAADDLRRLVDLEQPEVVAAGDVEQDAAGALDAGLEQRRADRRLRRLDGAVLAAGHADAHQRRAGVLHDGAHVGEVEVDEAGHRDEVGDALHALAQHVVGDLEGLDDRRAPLDDLQQPVVRDDDERVDLVAQALDAVRGLARAALALERERARDDADGERAELLGELGDDRRGAGAGAAALAGGDEDHVRALERLAQLVAALLGGLVADRRGWRRRRGRV